MQNIYVMRASGYDQVWSKVKHVNQVLYFEDHSDSATNTNIILRLRSALGSI